MKELPNVEPSVKKMKNAEDKWDEGRKKILK